jgi:hypothetical protein
MYEIHLFLGTAAAGGATNSRFPAGERHALLVFFRQPIGSDHYWNLAESCLEDAGWAQVALQKASKVVDRSVLEIEPIARSAYEDAMIRGSAIVIYSDPV